MKRIFPDVIDAYDRLDVFHSSDDIELGIAYDEYVNRLPTFQEYFKRISNKKALEAGAEMGIVSFYNKSSNKKKIVTLRRIMNLFRVIQPRLPEPNDPNPYLSSICYGFYGCNTNESPIGVWVEYFVNPLEAIAGSKLTIEDDNPYQLAIALADNYRRGNWKEFVYFQKNTTCSTK